MTNFTSLEANISRADADFIRDLTEQAKNYMNKFESAQVNCALIGMSGAGKSSLINAIAGQRIAKVGFTEQTTEVQKKVFYFKGLNFFDYPGLWY